jgi:hypothetical protein
MNERYGRREGKMSEELRTKDENKVIIEKKN